MFEWLKNVDFRYKVISGIVAVVLVVAAFIYAYNHFQSKPQPVTYMPQQQTETSAGVQKAADAAQVPINTAQAKEAADTIQVAAQREPDKIVQTTGANVTAEAENQRKKTGADFAIVTDPAKPNEHPAVKPDDPVQLNVYNIKAYPKHLVEVSIGARGGDIAYLHRVDVPKVPLLLPKGAVGYAGPFIRTEYGGGEVDAGIRLVVTF